MEADVLAVLAAAFLAHAMYRWLFARLPLHRDTGFYVPNYCVLTRRFGLFRGWNTYFSGASRALPQFVHSALYLAFGSRRYATAFRAVYALLSFATAWLAAGLAAQLFPAGGLFWVVLPLALALLAETQYGTHLESAEMFEAPCQLAGVLLVLSGLRDGNEMLTLGGLSLLWLDAAAIKLTGSLVALATSVVIAAVEPAWSVAVAAVGVGGIGAYLLWARASGLGLATLWRHLRRHERYVRRNYRSARLLLVKLAFPARLMSRNPLIPAAAGWGAVQLLHSRVLVSQYPANVVALAYVTGVVTAYLVQGHRVWYFLVPILPTLAILAGAGLRVSCGRFAVPMAIGLAAVSMVINLVPRLLLSSSRFNRWIFSVYDWKGVLTGSRMAAQNEVIEDFSRQIRPRVAGHTMLVVGPETQASLLCDAAYDTPLTTICELSRGVAGELAGWLQEPFARDPPAFVLDTEGSWEREAAALGVNAGLYEEVAASRGARLLQRKDSSHGEKPPAHGDLEPVSPT